MSPKTAEEIINKYGAALAAGTDGIARNISLLPCSKAKIKLAFYIYLAELISSNLLDQKLGENFVGTYSGLDSFIEDEKAKEINEIDKKIRVGGADSVSAESREKYFQFATNCVVNLKMREEINDYIVECQNK